MAPDLDPFSIPRHSFTLARKGFDTHEVRAYLHEVAEVVGRLQRAEAEFRERAERAETRAKLESDLDEHRLIEILGEETARVLEAARTAASEIRAKAEENVARLTNQAQEDAARIRSESDRYAESTRATADADADEIRGRAATELERKTAEAESVAAGIRAASERDAADLREEAAAARAQATADAEVEVEAARQQGREMVIEAQAVRERVLKDLARRRRHARQQVEKLNAGRERLLEAYEVVRETVEQATNELTVALPEARVLADAAARRVEDEPDASLDELEAELASARMAELPIVTPEEPAAAIAEPEAAPEDESPAETAVVELVPEPVADDEEVVERRSSTLRIFRRRDEPAGDLPEAQLVEVEAPSPDEGVRLLEPEPAPEPVADVAPEPEPEAEAESEVEAEADGPAVDELFARLRAERAETVATAQETLAAADPVDLAAEGDLDGSDQPPEADEVVEEEATPSADQVLLAERDEALGPIERELGKRLKRVLADEQNEVLDVLRRERPKGLDGVLPAVTDHAGRYALVAAEPLLEAATAGGGTATGDLADQLARSLVEPLRDRMERSFAESDGDLDDVADALRSLYREWKGQRITDGARHFVTAAYARGVFDAAPEGCALRWVVDSGGEPCPDADDNALAGAIAKGTPFPTGDLYPPAHPGCRCITVPERQ